MSMALAALRRSFIPAAATLGAGSVRRVTTKRHIIDTNKLVETLTLEDDKALVLNLAKVFDEGSTILNKAAFEFLDKEYQSYKTYSDHLFTVKEASFWKRSLILYLTSVGFGLGTFAYNRTLYFEKQVEEICEIREKKMEELKLKEETKRELKSKEEKKSKS